MIPFPTGRDGYRRATLVSVPPLVVLPESIKQRLRPILLRPFQSPDRLDDTETQEYTWAHCRTYRKPETRI